MTDGDGRVDRVVAPLETAGDKQEIEIQDEEESGPVKISRSPAQPTAKQEEEHRIDHYPYRSWCKFCVMGRGIGFQHRHAGVSRVPRIGIDYFFITASGVKKREELTEYPRDSDIEEGRAKGEIVKCVLIRDFESKVIFAHCVPCKGLDEDGYVVGLITADVRWLGYSEMILKADNEAAIQALLAKVVRTLKAGFENGERVSQEEPTKYESKSNGATEIGVKIVRGMFRTLRLCLEARIDKKIPVNHALIPWLLEHTCTVLNIRSRGEDGLTPWFRIKGRNFMQYILGFGEAVLYKLPTKGPLHNPDGNMGTRWKEGIFVGYHRSANVYLVATEDGLATARSLQRKPIANRWDGDKLAAIKITPWSLREKPEVQVRFQQQATVPEEPPTRDAPPNPKRFRINKHDLDSHGYTEGCQQCDYIMRYGSNKPGVQHTDRCRTRLIEEIGKTEAGSHRLSMWNERVNRSIAEQIEYADAQRRGGESTAGEQPRQVLDGHDAMNGDGAAPSGHPAAPSTDKAQPAEAPYTLPPERAERPITKERADRAAYEENEAALRGDAPGFNDSTTTAAGNDGTAANDDDGMHGRDAEEEDEPDQMDTGYIGSLEPGPEDVASELLLQQLGSTGRSYRRETRKAYKHLVSEIYSPPRITAELRRRPRRHLLPGFALDLTVTDPDDGQPWDFCSREKREKARALRRRQKPFLLIGSPMCTAFCAWQYLNEARSADPDRLRRARIQATLHIDFVMSLYREQVEDGLYFLHEHPKWATSWTIPSVKAIERIESVEVVHGDQCQFGAEAMRGKHRGSPILKPTGFMSNSPEIRNVLSKRCLGQGGACSRPSGGRHATLTGALAKDAARYPRKLCQAVLRGASAQLRADGRLKTGCFGVQALDDDNEVHDSLYGPDQGYSGRYKDDLTGQVLRDDLVRAARLKELDYFNRKGVWLKVPHQRARQRTGRQPISVRWVDVNKGDEQDPNYRSRLVARQIKAMDRSGQNFFAPAPPIESLRTVLSLAMTQMGSHKPDWNPSSPNRTQLSFVDVSRAYFNAKIDPEAEPTYVELPAEDDDHGRMCGELLRHMYGTRMAADGWQEEYSTLLIRLGFRQGASCPNVFHHESKQIACSVHGDDFTSSGPKPALDWLEKSIAEGYEITIGPRLGPGPNDAKEARSLNRVIRWCDDRIEYEADPRQVERLIAECGLTGAKPMSTPGIKATFTELENDEPLEAKLHTAFRSAAARGNYLSADRIDCQFACKEVCRWMSRPAAHSWKALKRLCRFLNGMPRLVYVYRQQTATNVDVYTDTDWAGCPKTRKSTSGGVVMLGKHTIKHWSSTQSSVTLSSGEAEFNGVIRGAGQGLGYQALLQDFGVELPLRLWTDSSAAIGICSRQGLGKLRHLDTHTLWIQQAVRNRRVDLRKVDGTENPADLLTKHSLTHDKFHQLVQLYDCQYRDGRAESAPRLRTGASAKVTMASGSVNKLTNNGTTDDLDEKNPTAGYDDTAVREETRSEEEQGGTPWMPHIALTERELDSRFPRLVAPEDEDLEDVARDTDDRMLQHGYKIAREIAEGMLRNGRTRRDCVDGTLRS